MDLAPDRSRLRRTVVGAALVAVGVWSVASCSAEPGEEGVPAVSMGSTNNLRTSGEAANASAPRLLESDPAPSGSFAGDSAEQAAETGSYLNIVDVRVGSHDGFDRVVFEFDGTGNPGFWVRYEDLPTQQGSGNPISVSGSPKLVIDIRGTGYPFDFGVTDFPSDPVQPDNTAVLTEIVGAGTYEGTIRYVAGLRGQRQAIKAFVIQNPTRLIVDIETAS